VEMEKFDFKILTKENSGSIVDESDFQSGFDKIFAPYKQSEQKQVVNQAAPTVAVSVPAPLQNLHTEKDLADSKAKGFEEGYAKGYHDAKSASDELNKKLNESLYVVFGKLGQVFEAKKFEDERDIADVVQIVVRVAKKVSDAAFATNAAEAVEKVVKKSFEMLFDEPKMVVLVGADVAEGINEKVGNLAKTSGFKGEFEIKAGNNIGAGGCEIEWQGGGLKSDKEAIWQEIDKVAKDLFDKKSKKKVVIE
jgi:flagellar biosynthesis/type III secretory pathway protein FliH